MLRKLSASLRSQYSHLLPTDDALTADELCDLSAHPIFMIQLILHFLACTMLSMWQLA